MQTNLRSIQVHDDLEEDSMSNENLDRSNPIKFVQYMQENPFYFEDIFRQPFTEQNADKIIRELRGFVGKPDGKKESTRKPERPHRKRIEKKPKV